MGLQVTSASAGGDYSPGKDANPNRGYYYVVILVAAA